MQARRATSSMKSLVIAISMVSATVGLARGEEPGGTGDEEIMVLGPRQFEQDTGDGAVLCGWSIYLSVQVVTEACGLERKPVDDAIDEAILAMDEFILANSSLHPTRAMLEDFKKRAAAATFPPEEWELDADGRPRLCSTDGRHQIVDPLRGMEPERIRTTVAKILAVPREPVMNPCL